MKAVLGRLKLFFVVFIMIVLPLTQFIYFIFSSTINGIVFYYISLLIVFLPIVFVDKSQLSYTLKYNTSQFLIMCFSLVSTLTLIFFLINSSFSSEENKKFNFNVSYKGTKYIRSTSHYQYLRLVHNKYESNYFVSEDEFNKYIVGNSVVVNLKKGLLGLLIIENIE